MALLKKIYQSFDMLGNRIKRLRVDTPSKIRKNENQEEYNNQKEFVANKEYVDTQTTYETELSKSTNKNSVFEWIGSKSLFGKSIQEILDLILYSKVNPKWRNPLFLNFSVLSPLSQSRYRKVSVVDYKYFYQTKTTGKLSFLVDIDLGDFESTTAPVIFVKTNSGTQRHSFTGEKQRLTANVTRFTFTLNLNESIFIESSDSIIFRYVPTNGIVKQNNFNENVYPSNTDLSNAVTEIDLTDSFQRQCFVCPALILIENNSFKILTTKIVQANQEAVFLIGYDKNSNFDLFEKLGIVITSVPTETENEKIISEFESINKLLVKKSPEFINNTTENVLYKTRELNLGYFPIPVKIKFSINEI